MNPSSFFALVSRMKYISRWGLMRNAIGENVQEHSHEVAVFAHALIKIDIKELKRIYDKIDRTLNIPLVVRIFYPQKEDAIRLMCKALIHKCSV